MKKILIIFIIALCLICFVESSCLALEITVTLTPGEFWKQLSGFNKYNYVCGYMLGIKECWNKLVPLIPLEKLSSKERKNLEEFLNFFTFMELKIVDMANTIDYLYKESANTDIKFELMCEFAYKKLKGENIEPLLQEARKEALQNQ